MIPREKWITRWKRLPGISTCIITATRPRLRILFSQSGFSYITRRGWSINLCRENGYYRHICIFPLNQRQHRQWKTGLEPCNARNRIASCFSLNNGTSQLFPPRFSNCSFARRVSSLSSKTVIRLLRLAAKSKRKARRSPVYFWFLDFERKFDAK